MYLALLTKQNKKMLSGKRLSLGHPDDTQIGQMMYYLTAVQMKQLSQTPLSAPHSVLNLFMDVARGRPINWPFRLNLIDPRSN